MPGPARPASRAERDAAYRVIGRYIVAFSRLISEMRVLIADYIARPDKNPAHVEMLLGDVGPKNVVDSFFGMLRVAGQLDDDERAIWSALRKVVVGENGVLQTRTDIAHGDWFVGLLGSDGHSNPILARIKASRTSGDPEEGRDFTVEELDAMADDLVDLTNTLIDVGRLCLGLPVMRLDEDGNPHTSVGEFRVGDVYHLEGTKKREAVRVTRTGPSAEIVAMALWVRREPD